MKVMVMVMVIITDGDGGCIKGPYLVWWDRCHESYANADDDDYIDFDG